jgi:hypothetical protein
LHQVSSTLEETCGISEILTPLQIGTFLACCEMGTNFATLPHSFMFPITRNQFIIEVILSFARDLYLTFLYYRSPLIMTCLLVVCAEDALTLHCLCFRRPWHRWWSAGAGSGLSQTSPIIPHTSFAKFNSPLLHPLRFSSTSGPARHGDCQVSRGL